MFVARALDQFYTRREVAASCCTLVRQHVDGQSGEWLWVEPSAGDGAFVDVMPFPQVALDIAPKRGDISRCDFMTWHPGTSDRRIAVIGNPPFGKNSSLARRFFDHAALFADVIAFILPRTFQKEGFVNRLNRQMHMVHESILDEQSFVFGGEDYAVPTVFQIWERRAEERPLIQRVCRHEHFSFASPNTADFAFQRVGARAGLVSHEGLRKSPQSHYFIKSHIGADQLFARLSGIDWNAVKWRTAGNPSIGKAELVASYEMQHG